MELFNDFKEHLLITSLQDIDIDSLKIKDRRIALRYKEKAFSKPKMADEKSTAIIVLTSDISPPTRLSTVSMCEDVSTLIVNTTHLFIDEAGQTPTSQIIHILTYATKLEKIFVTGDQKQLGVYKEDIPKYLHKYGFNSILNHALSIPSIPVIKLTKSYRSHPALTNIVAETFYDLDLEPGVSENQRAEALTFPFPVSNIPLLLVHTPEKDERDNHSFSRFNTSQTQIAKLITEKFLETTNLPIVIICLYKKQVEELKLLNLPRTKCITVDAYQAREEQIIILVTTKKLPENITDYKNSLTFINDPHRVAVAISRAKQAFCLIGDFDTLNECESWRKFINIATRYTPVINHNLLFRQAPSSSSTQNEQPAPPPSKKPHMAGMTTKPSQSTTQPAKFSKFSKPIPPLLKNAKTFSFNKPPIPSLFGNPTHTIPNFSPSPSPTSFRPQYSQTYSPHYQQSTSQFPSTSYHHPQHYNQFNFPHHPQFPHAPQNIPSHNNTQIKFFDNHYWQWCKVKQEWYKVPPPPNN
uniref:DNA2/NAM7 helicase-like C-terminal domain-containing protein n=2 Tax=Meloidogyne enterolobii TaxID=390850 RepID=A0A6V7Y2I3_MELEN|nr:unnamed protein product [Meloidogyne enterolobii]